MKIPRQVYKIPAWFVNITEKDKYLLIEADGILTS